uniref:CKLF-like MARVEL transmembrane domain-containing protein 8 n=1 Tax=Panthera onca TaxID=9690 RepID=UPI0029559620|nr:CKLF-like MARVEL transmembrane domain-containing protein 8 [Panthera onca]
MHPFHTRHAVLATSQVQRCPDLPHSLTTPPLCLSQGLCFNGSAFVLYLSAAVVDASSVSPERDSHNFNSWAASSFFAFLVTICYAGNTYFSFIAWRSRTIQ